MGTERAGEARMTTRPKISTAEVEYGGPISDCPVCQSHAGVTIKWKVAGDITQGYDLVPCSCRQGVDTHRDRLDAARRISGLAGLERYTFGNFNTVYQRQGHDAARRFARDANPPFLYLGGGTGTGKSHLLCAIGNHVLALGTRSVRYATVPGVVAGIAVGFRDEGERRSAARRYDDLLDAGVLLLDDLGAERDTSFAQERVWALIDYRYARRLPTAIASNTPRVNLEARLSSRLQDGKIVTAVNMSGADYRLSEERKREPDPWDEAAAG